MDSNDKKNKGLQVAGEHGAATTASRYGRDFLLAKIREKQGYSESFSGNHEIDPDDYNIFDVEVAEKVPAMPPMLDVLGPAGVIAKSLPGYESREPQLRMAQMVADAIMATEHAIVEAGTGTGKSLAYLIPAIYSRKRTVVSTADKGLQDQLWRKDIPFLKSVLPIAFTAAMLKGKNNYLCLDRYTDETGAQRLMGRSHEFSQVQKWLETTESGDLEELPFTLSPDLYSKITCSSTDCTGKQCPHYGPCYAERAKTKADQSDVVIVNHALLALDVALRSQTGGMAKVLPDHEIVILDEAHRLEDAATLAFTKEISVIGILRLLNDKQTQAARVDSSRRESIEDAADHFFALLAKLSAVQSYAVNEPPQVIRDAAEKLAMQLNDLARELKRLNPYVDSGDDKDREKYKKHIERVEEYANTIESILLPSPLHVVYVEKKQGAKRQLVYLKRCPISLADDLREGLFENWPTICTSATIATGQSFDYFKSRVGCDEARELIVDSPFDYKRNALIYTPADGRKFDPSRYYHGESVEYFNFLAEEIEKLLLASDGRAFCLFTSNNALNEVYNRIAHRLQWLVLKQGEMPRPEMVKQFKEDGHAVLFGTRSFFEGIDVQGEALSLVVIDKLPFGSPDDPIYQARCNAITNETGDKWAWFNKLALPTAIITLKQGFGRLIRTKSDKGVVCLLDGRLSTKNYGGSVIRSLPPATCTRSLEAIKTFFSMQGGSHA